jgi:hypothetical protein
MHPFTVLMVCFARVTIALMDISQEPGDPVRMIAELCDPRDSTHDIGASLGFD